MDVIARCVFGMTIENLGAKDDVFMRYAKVVFSPPINKTPLILLLCKFPFPLLFSTYLITDYPVR